MTKPKRPELNGTQLQRAIENAGGLWTVVELRKLGIIRWGDQLTDVPSVMIAPLEPQDRRFKGQPPMTRRYTGVDALRWAEERGRAGAVAADEAAALAGLHRARGAVEEREVAVVQHGVGAGEEGHLDSLGPTLRAA